MKLLDGEISCTFHPHICDNGTTVVSHRFKFGNVKLPKEQNIPWDGQGLGGELPRDAISKER